MNEYLTFLKNKSGFAAWLSVLLVILLTIPALLASDFKIIAKLLGVLLILIVCIALWYWKTAVPRNLGKQARIRLNMNDCFWLNQRISFYSNLSKSDKIIFEDRVGLFLAEITITEVGKEIAEKSTCLYVASSAIITFWGLPYWNYGDLSEVIVYPGDFTNDNIIDTKGPIQGKVHKGGLMDSTMIISLPSLVRGFTLNDGRNVGIHEFAHLLDKADGSIDGLPISFDSAERKLWYALVEKELRKKKPESKINIYAYTGQSEFFAVLMEVYRENPNRIEKRFPELYVILERNFKSQD